MMALFILIPGGDHRGYSDDEEEEEEEDGEYMDQETVEQFEDRVLNMRAAKVEETCTFTNSTNTPKLTYYSSNSE